jgi:outer membrane protein assembly factor BamB
MNKVRLASVCPVMARILASEPDARTPLRLWPGVVTVALQWLPWLVLPIVAPQALIYAMLAGAAGGLLIVVWWLLFSRAPWLERVGALVLAPLAVLAIRPFLHPSIENGHMGVMQTLYSIPVLSLALVAWAAASRQLARGPRLAALVASLLLASGVLALARTDGVRGEGRSDLHWRWTPTAEERLLAQSVDEPLPLASPPAAEATVESLPSTAGEGAAAAPIVPPPAKAAEKRPALPVRVEPAAAAPPAPVEKARGVEWPGFRGPARDGVVHGVRIATDWAASPPVEVWRRAIGPGWSSFAVHGDLVYTQEQRGDEEEVSCYRLATGEPVWRHGDPVRFWESNAGAGPRATPILDDGRVYSFGATGLLNALDASSGAVVWSRNAAADTEVVTPDWGFAGSPLVVGDVVIVAASGRLAGYDKATGQRRWLGPQGGGGYSSPHLATIGGVPQVLLLRGARSTSLAPADGTVLWEFKGEPTVSILQPSLTADSDILVAGGDAMGGTGIRRLAVAHGPSGWTASERWASKGLKPYFSDFVVHAGHAFGFDGSILSCIDLQDGTRKWKGGRYGHGQLVLLPEQDLLLVLSEDGELALVKATKDRFTELARVPAIEGKTWNHPVLVRDLLLVRNGQEAAAFRLARAGG